MGRDTAARALLLVAVMIAGPRCGTRSAAIDADSPGSRIRVVASIAPLADLVRRVGGDRVVVSTLVPPGASEHTWEPAPRDVARLRDVRLFVKVGAGFEPWAGRLVEASTEAVTIVDASQGVNLIADPDEPAHASGAGGGDGTAGVGTDAQSHANPHYWLDPMSVSVFVPRLAEVLATLDPEGREGYHRRAEDLRAQLDALDREIRARASRFTSRGIVTFHAAWDYFARRYGLTVVASIEAFPGREPGPRRVAEIVGLVRRDKVRAVFAEPQSSAKAAEAIAGECGVPLRVLDPLGGAGVTGRGDYFSLMRYNVGVLEETLR
jgi:ABC-type Zn uptake system ZnuABC Zn-binding protein ZnuA